jgi:hypothetical protein
MENIKKDAPLWVYIWLLCMYTGLAYIGVRLLQIEYNSGKHIFWLILLWTMI